MRLLALLTLVLSYSYSVSSLSWLPGTEKGVKMPSTIGVSDNKHQEKWLSSVFGRKEGRKDQCNDDSVHETRERSSETPQVISVSSTSTTNSDFPLQLPTLSNSNALLQMRAGAAAKSKVNPSQTPAPVQASWKSKLVNGGLTVWSLLQVTAILGNALKRLIPIALEPFKQQNLLPWQWSLMAVWAAYMAYAEGYSAFQKKFSPLVVKRAMGLSSRKSPLNILLAGPFSMGLFGATKKRMIVSWCISVGVFGIVKIVKILPYPYRSIVDAGVVAGLSYGLSSILIIGGKALLTGKSPDCDDCFPQEGDVSTNGKKNA